MSISNFHSLGLGLATLDTQGKVIEVYYPQPMLNPAAETVSAMGAHCGYLSGNADIHLSDAQRNMLADSESIPISPVLREALKSSQSPMVLTFLEDNIAPGSVSEVYLKLHLLSHRLCKPHSVNLQGAFGILRNIAWTNQGAIAVEELSARQLSARSKGQFLDVMSVDKFPKMVNYVVPRGVRIADTARVRLGAYVGEGTTVMHEGFINFNAGTEGSAMVEGRISAGVVIGEGSDLGGGCSTMGTLSGGGTAIISVGRDCLIGANAGIGIALGDRCIVEAGLYVTGGTIVSVLDHEGNLVQHTKARDLSGRNDLLFRRNSQTGAVECKTNKTSIALNEELHRHN